MIPIFYDSMNISYSTPYDNVPDEVSSDSGVTTKMLRNIHRIIPGEIRVNEGASRDITVSYNYSVGVCVTTPMDVMFRNHIGIIRNNSYLMWMTADQEIHGDISGNLTYSLAEGAQWQFLQLCNIDNKIDMLKVMYNPMAASDPVSARMHTQRHCLSDSFRQFVHNNGYGISDSLLKAAATVESILAPFAIRSYNKEEGETGTVTTLQEFSELLDLKYGVLKRCLSGLSCGVNALRAKDDMKEWKKEADSLAEYYGRKM